MRTNCRCFMFLVLLFCLSIFHINQSFAAGNPSVNAVLKLDVATDSVANCVADINGLNGAGATLSESVNGQLSKITDPQAYCQTICAATKTDPTSAQTDPNDPIVKQITAMYLDILHKQPDAEGLNYWVDQVKNHGLPISKVSTTLLIVAKVTEAYQTILGREPDKAGLDYWVDQVANHGKTIFDVQANFKWCKALPTEDPNHCS